MRGEGLRSEVGRSLRAGLADLFVPLIVNQQLRCHIWRGKHTKSILPLPVSLTENGNAVSSPVSSSRRSRKA
jgi:hypothetical protein